MSKKLLGLRLGIMEYKCYKAISDGKGSPVSREAIAKSLYNSHDRHAQASCSVLITRIKKKLGEEAIIHEDKGYVSRRARITADVNKRNQSQK